MTTIPWHLRTLPTLAVIIALVAGCDAAPTDRANAALDMDAAGDTTAPMDTSTTPPACSDASACPAGQACLASTGQCGECQVASQCRVGQACRLGECTACLDAGDCDGRLCAGGVCVSCIPGEDDDACAEAYDETYQCETVGACAPDSCLSGADCYAIDAVCIDNACADCQNASDCLVEGSGDYPLGTTCIEGRCIEPECTEATQDNDCQSNLCVDNLCVDCFDIDACGQGRVCNPLNRSCLEGSCLESSDCGLLSGTTTGQVCQSRECRGCLSDGDCQLRGYPRDTLCDADTSLCEPPTCARHADCPENLCVGGRCATCALDSDCGAGRVCDEDSGACLEGACVSDSDCAPPGDICKQAQCRVIGNRLACVETNIADGVFCDDGEFCTTDSECVAGQCVGSGDACDTDNLSCTEFICSGNQCSSPLIRSGWCLIDGACYQDRDVNPTNKCQECIALGGLADALAWSNDNNNFCGPGMACFDGACLTSCGADLVDLSTSEDHCGACFNLCAEGLVCDGGCVCDAAAPLTIIDVDPASMSHAPLGAVIVATYSCDVDAASVDAASFVVHGDRTGRRAGSFSALDVDAVAFDPADLFAPGEVVEVSALDAIQSIAGQPLVPRVWRFIADAGVGAGAFVARPESLGDALALGDIDGDGELDVLFNGALWLNTNGQARWAQSLGLAQHQDAAFGDLDSDGDLDLFIAVAGANEVWINVGGLLSDSGQRLGVSNSVGVALGDLDGDGDLDAWIANDSGQPDQLWINGGAGDFTPQGPAFGPSESSDVALGDLDSDGDLDALVSRRGGEADVMWLNQGGLNFAASAQSFPTVDTHRVALGDVDADGDLDTVTASDDAITVWVNDGTGILTPMSLGIQARIATLADADADGDLDVIFVDNMSLETEAFLNNSSGVFAPRITLSDADALDLVIGDLNGDARVDLFLRNDDGMAELWTHQSGALFLEEGERLGCCQGSTRGVTLGDLDGDGDIDAVRANHRSNEVWLNNGDATLVDSGQRLGDARSKVAALGDLDGDGDLDAFVVNGNTQPNAVWLNAGDASFVDSSQALGSSSSKDVALGDLDGDGDLDAFVVNDDTQPNRVWLNDGAGQFSSSSQLLGSARSRAVELADLDGDGDLDAVVANYGDNEVWLNAGDATFSQSQTLGGPDATLTLALGDYDLDGDVDVFDGNAKLWLNDGSGEFTDSGQILRGSYGYFEAVVSGDLDGDGDLDVIDLEKIRWINNGGVFIPFLRPLDGERTDVAAGLPSIPDARDALIALADLDGDGDLDALDATMTVWLNAPTVSFVVDVQTLSSSPSTAVALGDLDGDGDLDAIVANDGTSDTVWINNGGAFSSSGQSLGAGPGVAVALGDFNGDGALDAFIANAQDTPDRVWINDGSGVFVDSMQSLGAASSAGVAIGDIDGDGDLDVVVAHAGAGQANQLWLNQGLGVFAPSPQNLGAEGSGVALGDLDGDGDLDAVFSGPIATTWINTGAGLFVQAQDLGPLVSASVALGDVDGDGDLDAWLSSLHQPGALWINDGTSAWTLSPDAVQRGHHIALADLDGDGDLDAWRLDGGEARVSLNDGAGRFVDSGQRIGVASGQMSALGDFNGDGALDAFVAADGANVVVLQQP